MRRTPERLNLLSLTPGGKDTLLQTQGDDGFRELLSLGSSYFFKARRFGNCN